jgi:hypothetical protein
MICSKILWLSLMTSIAIVASISTENALASFALLDEEEAVEAEDATSAGATDQTIANGNTTDVQFLAIQNAKSGSINEINATAYTLELGNVSDSTILFSDRPERIVTSVSTSDFIGNWTTGPDSFAEDAPNDALIIEDIQTGNLETAIIESFNPVYDPTANTLTYTITAENQTSVNLPSEFGQSVLVIDGFIY